MLFSQLGPVGGRRCPKPTEPLTAKLLFLRLEAARAYLVGLHENSFTLRRWPLQLRGPLECGRELDALPQEECESGLLAS